MTGRRRRKELFSPRSFSLNTMTVGYFEKQRCVQNRLHQTHPCLFLYRKVLKEISVGELQPDETVDAVREARVLSRLHHPSIVKFHDSFIDGEFFCIITEYCDVSVTLWNWKTKTKNINSANSIWDNYCRITSDGEIIAGEQNIIRTDTFFSTEMHY